ncbi:MAG: response regulator [Elusimicrobiales bacterium]
MAKKILIIEDNDRNRIILRDILLCQKYEVLEAAAGREGIEIARREKPDLILLDIQMPGLDGYDTGKLLKSFPETKSIPLVAVTSYAMEGDKSKILASGIDDYISKPYDVNDMVALVKSKVNPDA